MTTPKTMPAQTNRMITEAEVTIAQTQRQLEASRQLLLDQDDTLRPQLRRVKQMRENELRKFVYEQIRGTRLETKPPGDPVTLDATTRLARQVRRRRVMA